MVKMFARDVFPYKVSRVRLFWRTTHVPLSLSSPRAPIVSQRTMIVARQRFPPLMCVARSRPWSYHGGTGVLRRLTRIIVLSSCAIVVAAAALGGCDWWVRLSIVAICRGGPGAR
jgi:hypothetical protein